MRTNNLLGPTIMETREQQFSEHRIVRRQEKEILMKNYYVGLICLKREYL